MCNRNKLTKIKVDEKIQNRFYFLAQRDANVELGNWIKQHDLMALKSYTQEKRVKFAYLFE